MPDQEGPGETMPDQVGPGGTVSSRASKLRSNWQSATGEPMMTGNDRSLLDACSVLNAKLTSAPFEETIADVFILIVKLSELSRYISEQMCLEPSAHMRCDTR